MKHLIFAPEYPPAPGGGIGTYNLHIARLLAEHGETVHVITLRWIGAEQSVETSCDGRLVVHHISVRDWNDPWGPRPHPDVQSEEAQALYASVRSSQAFAWLAALYAERLIEAESFDTIEGEEYDAPLYYFLLRRALGLGPRQKPPVFVHFHSPTELIALNNDFDTNQPEWRTSMRLEEFCIAAADAYLCPSRYLARQVSERYNLPPGSVQVIPYPKGPTAVIERSAETWRSGTICYMGRLERRKGVLEWLDAAVAVAEEHPDVRFEFLGANVLGSATLSSDEMLERAIPHHLRSRFIFRGQQQRADLPKFLANARMVTVPSRWENFPNTCIEAMSSGLPVIVSPEGGMAEMARDGISGWHAASAAPHDLAATLRRAIATPPEQLAAMGRQARCDIDELCNNEAIAARHIAFRAQVAQAGATRSLRLPVGRPTTEAAAAPAGGAAGGIAVVINGTGEGQGFTDTIASLLRQTVRPAAVALLHDDRAAETHATAIAAATERGWHIHRCRRRDLVAARNEAVQALLAAHPSLQGFIFIDKGDQLRANGVELCATILTHSPEVGVVSGWGRRANGTYYVRPSPAFPYQWLEHEALPFSAVRTEAFQAVGGLRTNLDGGYELWDLTNAILAAGWAVVTAPAVLGDLGWPWPSIAMRDTHMRGTQRIRLLERFPELITRDAMALALMVEPGLEPEPAAATAAYAADLASIRWQSYLKATVVRQLRVWLPQRAFGVLDRVYKRAQQLPWPRRAMGTPTR